MTEIIDNLHQIGAHEIEEIENADLVIDVGGILSRQYSLFMVQGDLDSYKEWLNVPILSFEIDEVDDEPFHNWRDRILNVRRIAAIGEDYVRSGLDVYALCLAGQNRSGLVVGLILKGLGWTGHHAVRHIQEKRENALNNANIRDYLLNE